MPGCERCWPRRPLMYANGPQPPPPPHRTTTATTAITTTITRQRSPPDSTPLPHLQSPPLEPRRLIPALLRYGEPGASPLARRHVLRYVEYAIEEQQCDDR